MKKIISTLLPVLAMVSLLVASPALARRDHSEGDSDNPRQIQLFPTSVESDSDLNENATVASPESPKDAAESAREAAKHAMEATRESNTSSMDDNGNDEDHGSINTTTTPSSSTIQFEDDSNDHALFVSSTFDATTDTSATIDSNLTSAIAEIRRVLMEAIQSIIDTLISNTPSAR